MPCSSRSKIRGENWPDIGTNRRRAGALELLDFGQHIRRQIDRNIRQRRSQQRAEPSLVLRVEEAEQERDRNGIGARRFHCRDQSIDLVFSERRHDRRVGPDAFRNLEPAPARNEHRRRVLEQVVEIRARRAPQLKHIAETTRCNQGCPRAGLFEDGVGHDGGRVGQEPDLGRGHRVAIHRQLEGAQHAFREVIGCGRDLRHADAAAGIFDQGNVGESPADIDPDPPGHPAISPFRWRNYCRVTDRHSVWTFTRGRHIAVGSPNSKS